MLTSLLNYIRSCFSGSPPPPPTTWEPPDLSHRDNTHPTRRSQYGQIIRVLKSDGSLDFEAIEVRRRRRLVDTEVVYTTYGTSWYGRSWGNEYIRDRYYRENKMHDEPEYGWPGIDVRRADIDTKYYIEGQDTRWRWLDLRHIYRQVDNQLIYDPRVSLPYIPFDEADPSKAPSILENSPILLSFKVEKQARDVVQPFPNLALAQANARKWLGENPVIHADHATDQEGTVRMTVQGVTLTDLFPSG